MLPRSLWAALCCLLLLTAPSEAAKKKKSKDDGALAGTVSNAAGEPLEGVAVKLTAPDPATFSDEAVTDGKGEFEIPIPAAQGEYHLLMTRDGYAPFEHTFDFVLGEEKSINFTLVDEATGRRQQAIAAFNAGADTFNAGDRDGAKAKFQEAAELDGKLAEPHLALADIYLGEEAWEKAASHAEQYLALKPGDQQAQVIAHEAYRHLGNQAKVDELRQALRGSGFGPQLAVQVYNEGALASQRSDWEAAEAKFREALELDPKLAQAYSALAGILYNRGAHDQVLELVDKLLELVPENVEGRRYRYLVHDARADAAAAAAALDAYVEVDREGAADLLYQRADLDFRSGNNEGARGALLKVIELKPDFARAYYTLGLVYAGSDTAKAKQYLQKFLEMAPDDPEAASAREMISYF